MENSVRQQLGSCVQKSDDTKASFIAQPKKICIQHKVWLKMSIIRVYTYIRLADVSVEKWWLYPGKRKCRF